MERYNGAERVPTRHRCIAGLVNELRVRDLTELPEGDIVAACLRRREWIKSVRRDDAMWKPHAGLYTTTHIRASLDPQRKTRRYLERAKRRNGTGARKG